MPAPAVNPLADLPLEVAAAIAARWGGAPGSVRFLSQGRNRVYELRRGEEELVLRLTCDEERRAERIERELEWQRCLDAEGAPVSRPTRSREGGWVETFPFGEGRFLHAVAFHKAAGRSPDASDPDWRDGSLLQRIGRALGGMHALAGGYVPPPALAPFAWVELDLPSYLASAVPPGQPRLLERLAEHWLWLNALPRLRGDGYGLIHGDFHRGNLLVDDTGALTVIDFDNCCCAWFAFDLAHFLNMALLPFLAARRKAREVEAHFLFRHLMAGYSSVHELDRRWLERLPGFMQGLDLMFLLDIEIRLPGKPLLRPPYYRRLLANALAGRACVELDFARLYDEVRAAPPPRAEPGEAAVCNAAALPLRLVRRLLRRPAAPP